jgi:hypothetical protein
VKVAAGIVGLDPAARPPLSRDRALQLLDVALTAALGGQPGDAGLQDRPYLEAPQHGVEAKVSHAEAVVGVPLDETLAPETS